MAEKTQEDLDPETGEVKEESMNGEVTHAPPSFAHFLTTLQRGGPHEEISGEMQKLVQNLRDEATVSGRKEKGSLTLKIDLTIEGDMMFISYDVKRKDPAPKRLRSVAFHTSDGVLMMEDPKQGSLPLKVAGFAGPMKHT